jgi:hypothetical protein
MNKCISITLFFLLSCTFLYSKEKGKDQSACIHKGNITFSGAYGFPSIVRAFLKIRTDRAQYSIMGMGPLMFKCDFMLNNRWSIGINAAYNFSRISWLDGGYDPQLHHIRDYEYGIEAEEISGTVRTNYHFRTTNRKDVYAGFGLGYGHLTLASYTEAPLNQFSVGYAIPKPFSVEATIGYRHYFFKNIGIYTELGLGKSWILFKKYFLPEAIIQAGINLKF